MSNRRNISQMALRCLGLNFRDRATREIERGSDELARETVGRLSRGSVGVQLRDFVTKEDLERERNDIRSIDFAS